MNAPQFFRPCNRSAVFILSLLVAGLMTALSLTGLLFPMATYPNEDLRQSFATNDVVNLVIGLPVLVGTLWLTRRAKLLGLLGLPGARLEPEYDCDQVRQQGQ